MTTKRKNILERHWREKENDFQKGYPQGKFYYFFNKKNWRLPVF